MNNFLQERKAKKREAKIEFYSAVFVVGTVLSILIFLEVLWITRI